MESKRLKTTKYLVLGESKNAFHGVLPLYLFLIIFISGCSWFADNRIVAKPKLDTTSVKYQEMVSNIINHRYEKGLKELKADLAYQEYLLNKEAEKTAMMSDYLTLDKP